MPNIAIFKKDLKPLPNHNSSFQTTNCWWHADDIMGHHFVPFGFVLTMIHIVSWIVSSTTSPSQFGTLTLTPVTRHCNYLRIMLTAPPKRSNGFEVSHYRELTYGKLGFNLDPQKEIAKDPPFFGVLAPHVKGINFLPAYVSFLLSCQAMPPVCVFMSWQFFYTLED